MKVPSASECTAIALIGTQNLEFDHCPKSGYVMEAINTESDSIPWEG